MIRNYFIERDCGLPITYEAIRRKVDREIRKWMRHNYGDNMPPKGEYLVQNIRSITRHLARL